MASSAQMKNPSLLPNAWKNSSFQYSLGRLYNLSQTGTISTGASTGLKFGSQSLMYKPLPPMKKGPLFNISCLSLLSSVITKKKPFGRVLSLILHFQVLVHWLFIFPIASQSPKHLTNKPLSWKKETESFQLLLSIIKVIFSIFLRSFLSGDFLYFCSFLFGHHCFSWQCCQIIFGPYSVLQCPWFLSPSFLKYLGLLSTTSSPHFVWEWKNLSWSSHSFFGFCQGHFPVHDCVEFCGGPLSAKLRFWKPSPGNPGNFEIPSGEALVSSSSAPSLLLIVYISKKSIYLIFIF